MSGEREGLRPARRGGKDCSMSVPAVAGPCPECGVDNASDHNYCKHCGTMRTTLLLAPSTLC